MRSFIALPLPEEVCEALSDIAHSLPIGRPVPEENLHLTLAFLDDLSQSDLERTHETLDTLSAPPVTLRLAGLELFGGKAPALMAIRATGAEALHTTVTRAVARAGLTLPRRRFRGHVTLTRFPRRMDPGQLSKIGRFLEVMAAIQLPDITVDTMGLYSSHLHSDGARYDLLADYPLQG